MKAGIIYVPPVRGADLYSLPPIHPVTVHFERNAMLTPKNDLAPGFTARLLPAGDEASAVIGDDALLPLIQHWTLALLLAHDKSHLLLGTGRLRRLFKVGRPEYWSSRHDEDIEYEDDTERSYNADLRRQKRRAAELLIEAQTQLAQTEPDFSHPLFQNLSRLGELLGLNDTELTLLCVLVLLHGDRRFYGCVSNLSIRVGHESDCVALFANMTACTAAALHIAFRPDSALRRTGLLTLTDEAHDMEDFLVLQDGVAALLLASHDSAAPLIRHFFTPRAPSLLGCEHFPHLSDEIRTIAGILGGAMRARLPGTNVLIYGPPGVGKTELAAAIAQQLSAALFEVGFADSKGDPMRGIKRLQSYNLCQRLLSRRTDALVLFDEVEDMLEQGETPGKAWVNRALEENQIPAIWITNNVQALDPAYQRRFDYSLQVKTPPRAVRLTIAQHHLADIASSGPLDVAGQDWLAGLAECPELTPAQMARAAKVARLVESDTLTQGNPQPARQRVLQVLERSAKLLAQPKLRPGREMATAYDLAYLHTDAPIAELVESLRQSPAGSMCFYGPPGAGKTALARFIAQALELPVLLRRASDLLSMYVGGSEHNIANMFEAAAAEPCVLILDEADSFLQSRAQARHSWEITQVNELLTQMEEFEGLFICTTNLLEKLDAASLRRFDWKIAFKPMTASQRWAFFLQEFHLLGGSIEAAQALQAPVRQQLAGLTPGDFAPVTRQFRLLRRTPSAQDFFNRLHQELKVKQGGAVEPVRHFSAYDGGQSHKTAQLAA